MNIPKRISKILFVCHGNICRSPMAEFVMKDLLANAGVDDVLVESAAVRDDEIGNDIHHGTRGVLIKHNIPFEPRGAWRLTAKKASEYDIIVAMDEYNMADLRALLPTEIMGRVCKMKELFGDSADVDDPWFTGDFDKTYDEVLSGCNVLLSHIKSER